MKKSKLPLIITLTLLNIGAVVVTYANVRRFTVSSAYFTADGGSCWFTVFYGASGTDLTTVPAVGKTARCATAAGRYTLRTGKSVLSKVLFYGDKCD
jgi:hypothetical protein